MATSSAFDDEDLALSINPSYTRRGSARSPGEQSVGSGDGGDIFSQHDAGQGNNGRNKPAVIDHANARDPSAAKQNRVTNQRLGQYEIIKTLGEGSFGKVKLAVHSVSGQRVALKIISRRKLMARDMQGRTEREIQYLQLLRHPHIIKLYTVITTPTEIIMVLEYAGSELFNYIVEHGKMGEEKARRFFQQIVCAVEYCHKHKIVHRDLKPENLLLDDNFHVKIADFGLSNIMTDGNFLKTSCGSPNYAAPEVISGKLYAGPEVDVWSCGVILYVLLVGRLPFDDEYIPALFKKIAQGNYHVPHYLTPGAARLIKKMLQTSPVNRITIEEIRQDSWFNKNLPEYLQPTVQEFIDTGVDPNKAIDPRAIAPSKPQAIVEKFHEKVIHKLGRTMGYGKEDVQQALAIDEPNAIKDAYLIVAENQIMRETPSMKQEPALQPFLAQSPPTTGNFPMAEALDRQEPLGQGSAMSASPRTGGQADHMRRLSGGSSTSPGMDHRNPVNTIGVLPSSLPDYHKAYMKGHPKPPTNESGRRDSNLSATLASSEDRARNLKQHSRSQAPLPQATHHPEGMTPIQQPSSQKKPRPTKWQFGIRSRNQPAEAMLAIYKALKAMGAEWEVPKLRKPGSPGDGSEGGSPGADEDEMGISSSGSEDNDDDDGQDSDSRRNGKQGQQSEISNLRRNEHYHSNSTTSTQSSASYEERRRRRYGSWNDWGYNIPQDPWIINARFRKNEMFAPGVMHPNSAHSSRADLTREHVGGAPGLKPSPSQDSLARSRRSSTLSSHGSANANPGAASLPPGSAHDDPAQTGPPAAHGSSTSLNNAAPGTGSAHASPHLMSSSLQKTSVVNFGDSIQTIFDDSAYVYITIQLYSIEKEFYLVDFKCAGYERLQRKVIKKIRSSMSGSDARSTTNGADDSPTDQFEDFSDDDREDLEDDDDDDFGEPLSVVQSRPPPKRQDTQDSESHSGHGEGSGGFSGSEGLEREEIIADGRAIEEKDVSSPFPFLDVASRLIIQLAEAD